jgi:membrane-bound lytic murein transglycosylase D
MKKFTVLMLLVIPFMTFANYNKQDTIQNTVIQDSINKLINNPSLDKEMDSIISVRPLAIPDDNEDSLFVEIDTTKTFISDYPDSFYIKRLSKIPSVVELTYNQVVKRFIEVYTVKRRDRVEEMLSLRDYYFPIFEEVLDKNGLPLELKYMAVIESALNPYAVSRAGATGLWQFMYGTGRLYKLNINSFIDERRDPFAASNAAAKFLKDLYSVYNDWTLVIAAYNCGPGNVNKAIRRSGGKRNYWDIYYYLPRETRGYVPAFISAMYVMNYYQDHGLSAKSIDVPPLADTIMVNKNIHLQQIADVLHLPLQELRELNPQYRRDIIPGKYITSPLRLPTEYALHFIDFEDSIVKYKSNEYLSGDFKITPIGSRSSRYLPGPPRGDMQKIYHKIITGETLGQIAEQYHVRTDDLRYWNDIYRNRIWAGKNLVIYLPKKRATQYTETAKNPEVKSTSTLQQTNTAQTNSTDYIYYEVKTGDSLWKIASQYPGVSDEDLMKWNNLTYRSKIQPGQTLKIKKINN